MTAIKENLSLAIDRFLAAHDEWLLIDAAGRSFALRRAEIEIEERAGRTLINFLDDRGCQTWRVAGLRARGRELTLDLSRDFAREKVKIRFVPRRAAAELSESVELARRVEAGRLAARLCAARPQTRLVGVRLLREHGRLAEITLEHAASGRRLAFLSDLTGEIAPETLLAKAVMRLAALAARRRHPIETLTVAAGAKQARRLQKLRALLRAGWRTRLEVAEISTDGEKHSIVDLPHLAPDALFRARPRRAPLPAAAPLSEAAQAIAALAAEATDVVGGRHGETLRFRGLAFARVRKVCGRERIWFGFERMKSLADEADREDLFDLIENLKTHRRFDSANKRHAFYAAAPEAWLESILRRDIGLLDANLIVSPVYQQFRAEREKIDLLALRRDGRLVIVELKTRADRDMIYQAADYWRRIEAERRAGNLARAGLFGARPIADRPAVCYLAAPALAFHRDFDFLAATLAPEIEMHRFDLAENWRERVKVIGRELATNRHEKNTKKG